MGLPRGAHRAITVQSSPAAGVTASTLFNDVRARFEAIELPPGYTLEWDGEYDGKRESTAALVPGVVPGVVVMLFFVVVLFNAYRAPLIIVHITSFAAVGITLGLLVTRAPFGFMALLVAMSLAGMNIRYVVVLQDQVNLNLAEGQGIYDAVVEAAVSRLWPVINTAAATVPGLASLLTDGFWVSIAVTIMFGLAFATLYRVPVPASR